MDGQDYQSLEDSYKKQFEDLRRVFEEHQVQTESLKKELEGKLEEVGCIGLEWKTKYEDSNVQLSQHHQRYETLEKEALQLRTELTHTHNMFEAYKENQKVMETHLKSELHTWQRKYHSLEADYQSIQLENHKILDRCSELEETTKSMENEIQKLHHDDLQGK
jgi:predicted  nucleic acid-binding Zn-ribbon protein